MIKSVNNLCQYYIGLPKEVVVQLSQETGKYYNTFIKKQKKPNGIIKHRKITQARGILKKVQKSINNNILQKIDFPSPPFIGGLKGKDNILNAHFHKGKTYKFCTDLKNFYPHINNRMVYKSFTQRGFSADVASLLTKLTTYEGGLIQGGVNSTHIAYLAIWNTATELLDICNQNSIVFTIYVDDMTFSSHNDFKDLSIILRNKIIEGGFFINHNKTFYTRGKANITGVKVGQNTLNVMDEFRTKLENTQGMTPNQKIGLKNYYKRVVTYDRSS